MLRLPHALQPTDIGVEGGLIAVIEPGFVCDAPEYDAGGRLVCGGLIESHIHLDKAGIIGRCSICAGTLAEAVSETAKAKAAFTEEDVYQRASAGPRKGDPQRDDAAEDVRRGRPARRVSLPRRDQAAQGRLCLGDRDRDLRLRPGRSDQRARDRGDARNCAQVGSRSCRRLPLYRSAAGRAHPPHLRPWRALPCPGRFPFGFPSRPDEIRSAGGHRPNDRAQIRRPRVGRARHQPVGDDTRRPRGARQSGSRRRRSR